VENRPVPYNLVVITRSVVVAILAAAAVACGSSDTAEQARTVQPGAPGEPSREVTAAASASTPGYADADIKFMQGMIHHHAQALDMTELLRTRTEREDMKLLAQRIDVSQTDEINMMRQWLRDRGAEVPDEHAHHMPGAPLMPGMLTAEEMAELGAAKGTAFDKLFLEYMIKHHQGALTMVKELFASPGAGQESDIFAFASDVEADQAMEIERMGAMLAALR
jgi:uncharacterized protein (DUF305 family)